MSDNKNYKKILIIPILGLMAHVNSHEINHELHMNVNQ
jgi:hypothetical protein